MIDPEFLATQMERISQVPFSPNSPIAQADIADLLEDLTDDAQLCARFVTHIVRHWKRWEGLAALQSAWIEWRPPEVSKTPAAPSSPEAYIPSCAICEDVGVFGVGTEDPRWCDCRTGRYYLKKNPELLVMYRRSPSRKEETPQPAAVAPRPPSSQVVSKLITAHDLKLALRDKRKAKEAKREARHANVR